MMQCDKKERGCAGGFPDKAWKFLAKTGTVAESCDPYNLTRQFVCSFTTCLIHFISCWEWALALRAKNNGLFPFTIAG